MKAARARSASVSACSSSQSEYASRALSSSGLSMTARNRCCRSFMTVGRQWAPSLLAEDEVDRPAAADVRPRPAQVCEDIGVRSTGLFQRVGQNGEESRIQRTLRQRTLLVRCLGQMNDRRRQPGGIDGHGAERVTEDAADQCGLDGAFCPRRHGLLKIPHLPLSRVERGRNAPSRYSAGTVVKVVPALRPGSPDLVSPGRRSCPTHTPSGVTGICLGDKRSSPFKTRTQLANELEHLIMGGTCGDGNRAKFLIIRYPVSVQLCHLNSSTAALIDQQIPNPTATGDGKQAAFPSGEAEPRPPQ